MKVRLGFVSNSSSASYIIGIGKVIDEVKITEFCKKHSIDFTIRTTEEILNDGDRYSPTSRVIGAKIYAINTSFTSSDVSCLMDTIDLQGKYIYVDYSHDIQETGDSNVDYDIDEREFDHTAGEHIFKIGIEQGVKNFDCTYGAGRNG